MEDSDQWNWPAPTNRGWARVQFLFTISVVERFSQWKSVRARNNPRQLLQHHVHPGVWFAQWRDTICLCLYHQRRIIRGGLDDDVIAGCVQSDKVEAHPLRFNLVALNTTCYY